MNRTYYSKRRNNNGRNYNRLEDSEEKKVVELVNYEGDIPDQPGEKCEIVSYKSFNDMKLGDHLLKSIYNYGFQNPSSVQQKAIRVVCDGYNCEIQAHSGSGKTCCEIIGLLNKVDPTKKYTQSLLIVNTRELAQQIHSIAQAFIQPESGITMSLLIGGFQKDNGSFGRFGHTVVKKEEILNTHVIIATPGRLIEKLDRRDINLSGLRIFVMDEADILLLQFQEDLRKIFGFIPEKTQLCFFSATIPPEMDAVVKKIVKTDIVKILVKNEDLTLDGIQQYYVGMQHESEKFEYLCDLYDQVSITQCIIYCNTKRKVQQLTDRMKEENFVVSCILGDMTQAERNEVMRQFRKGEIRVLITTDILARGIDVQQVSLVINYDLPFEKETYIHRIGRSGRFGRKGTVINFVVNDNRGVDVGKIKELEGYYNTMIAQLPENLESLL